MLPLMLPFTPQKTLVTDKVGKLVKDVFENKSLFDCNYCLII